MTKAMNQPCECFERVRKDVEDRIRANMQRLGKATLKVSWYTAGRFEGEAQHRPGIGLWLQEEHVVGRDYQYWIGDDMKVPLVYCPFCGEKIEEVDVIPEPPSE